MAFQLDPGKPIALEIRRVVLEALSDAAGQLRGTGAAKRDEAIHEARKNVKKVRGVLRLVEPQLGDVFAIENARLRNVGRALSHFRDAGAMIEIFDEIKAEYRDDLGKHTLASVRRGLMAGKKHAETGTRIGPVLERMADTLARAQKRAGKWRLEAIGFPAIEPGLKETFRRCRRSLARARKHPTPENFHDWRKRVKQHWYHVRLLSDFADGEMQDYEKDLKRLETHLGEEHNSVVLRGIVLAKPALFGKDAEVKFFLALLDRYQAEQRHSALSAGKDLYREKPRAFVKRMRSHWSQREAVSIAAGGHQSG